MTQIVRQVREWSMQAAGGELGEYNEVQRLRLAEETLRIQFDSAMRMAMQEWHKSRREGLGRATYLNAASRLSANLAKLYGVDVSGKTARLKAEQQGKEEYEQRRARAAEKALWETEQKSAEAFEDEKDDDGATPVGFLLEKEEQRTKQVYSIHKAMHCQATGNIFFPGSGVFGTYQLHHTKHAPQPKTPDPLTPHPRRGEVPERAVAATPELQRLARITSIATQGGRESFASDANCDGGLLARKTPDPGQLTPWAGWLSDPAMVQHFRRGHDVAGVEGAEFGASGRWLTSV